MKKIKFDKIRKLTPEEMQRAIDADLIRTTERTKETLELIWKWKGSGLRAFATDGETERLTAVCERAEHATYQCEIIERTYHQYKRKQCDLAAADWCEIIDAIRYAELAPSDHEATPDWDWFINHVLFVAQGLKDESLKAVLQAQRDIINRVKKELANNQGASCEMRAMLKDGLAMLKDIRANTTAAANTRPRSDKGGKHKRAKKGWRLQTEMVGDFSKCAFKYGGKTYGEMTKEKAKDWETRYQDANKRERKSGYYSEMRRNPDLKKEYWNAAARWNNYWGTFKKDFTAWLKDNPRGTIDLFKMTWTPPGKTVAMNPTDKTLLYGADTRFADSPDGNDI